MIYWTVDHGYFEFAFVDLEVTVYYWKGAPAHGDVIGAAFAAQVYQFEDHDV